MPDDFFIVGFKQRNEHPLKTSWQFCLAADCDERLDKISLEFLTDHLNRKRFEAIVWFTDWLIQQSQPCENWVIQT
jgi:hypothetical protein